MAHKLTTQDRQWEVEDAMRTLQRAKAIESNRPLMKEVKKSITDLSKMVNGGTVKKPGK